MMTPETRDKLNGILERGITLNTSGHSLWLLANQACDYLNQKFNSEGVFAEVHSQVEIDMYHALKKDKVATIIFDELGVSFSEDTTAEDFAFVTLQFREMIVYMKKLMEN